MTDRFNLNRYLDAQQFCYADVIDELNHGQKRSHWMWFIFPQILGLGQSPTAIEFSIRNAEEGLAYLAHPVLGVRLRECASILLALRGHSAHEIFGSPDDLKLCSSMTLFQVLAPEEALFGQVLQQYYGGEHCERTLELMAAHC